MSVIQVLARLGECRLSGLDLERVDLVVDAVAAVPLGDRVCLDAVFFPGLHGVLVTFIYVGLRVPADLLVGRHRSAALLSGHERGVLQRAQHVARRHRLHWSTSDYRSGRPCSTPGTCLPSRASAGPPSARPRAPSGTTGSPSSASRSAGKLGQTWLQLYGFSW
jgi:hypothetical protein